MAAEIENISDFEYIGIEKSNLTIEEKLESAARTANETGDNYTKSKLARSFIKTCLLPEMMDEDDAVSFIKLKIKERFGLKGPVGKSIVTELLNYFKKLNKSYAMCKCSKTLADVPDNIPGCEEIDPEDIDDDERDFDQETLKRAEEEAESILSTGHPIKYIKDSVSRIHVGDDDTIEGLCISTAGQSILNTDGIQIAVNGESGSGKSHGAKCFLHHVPRKWKRSTSLSSKALFYMELKPGMIIFSDDTDMDPDLAAIFKQSTTNYQETTHRTTVKDQKKQIVSVPARTNLVLTCVESHVSDQVLNRQLVFETDTSEKQKFSIYQKQKEIEKLKITKLTVTFEVLVCRRIFAKLKEQKYNVAIPFADYIEVADYSNSRIQPLLFDMIRGYAMFNYKQRQIDEDGWLVATKDDFYAAKNLFKSREANTVTKLTKPELEIVKYIIKHQKSTGCSGNDIATGTGIRYNTVHRLINGRNDRPDDDGGLLSKVKGMTKEKASLTQYIREDGELIESQGKQHDIYKIVDYNPWDLFESDFITIYDDV